MSKAFQIFLLVALAIYFFVRSFPNEALWILSAVVFFPIAIALAVAVFVCLKYKFLRFRKVEQFHRLRRLQGFVAGRELKEAHARSLQFEQTEKLRIAELRLKNLQLEAAGEREAKRAEHEARRLRLHAPKYTTPRDFELWCANILVEQGWKAECTPASGDHGADVIAEKLSRRIVVQCKLYSKPVGNGAVQEIFTACRHYQAQAAIVVTNAGYTKQAKEVAASTGVLLLSAEQFMCLDRHLNQVRR